MIWGRTDWYGVSGILAVTGLSFEPLFFLLLRAKHGNLLPHRDCFVAFGSSQRHGGDCETARQSLRLLRLTKVSLAKTEGEGLRSLFRSASEDAMLLLIAYMC